MEVYPKCHRIFFGIANIHGFFFLLNFNNNISINNFAIKKQEHYVLK